MDLGTHIVTGLIASTFVDNPTAKVLCVVGSLAPDLVFVPYYVYRILKKDWHFWRHLKKDGPSPHHPQWEINAYSFVHSFVFVGLLFLAATLFSSVALWGLSIGYATHVLWDIPSHKGKWAQKPFYPFLNWQIHGFDDWWKHHTVRKLVAIGWGVLISLYFFIEKSNGFFSF